MQEYSDLKKRTMTESSEIKEILAILQDYTPIIIGTFPIGINISGSDIDIACYARDLKAIRKIVQHHFSDYSSFYEKINTKRYAASFYVESIQIEIYAEPIPTKQQNGYRHMVIENRILKLLDASFRNAIINLKEKGYKTEPAFGKLLKMKEPYTELLLFERLDDKELKEHLTSTLRNTPEAPLLP